MRRCHANNAPTILVGQALLPPPTTVKQPYSRNERPHKHPSPVHTNTTILDPPISPLVACPPPIQHISPLEHYNDLHVSDTVRPQCSSRRKPPPHIVVPITSTPQSFVPISPARDKAPVKQQYLKIKTYSFLPHRPTPTHHPTTSFIKTFPTKRSHIAPPTPVDQIYHLPPPVPVEQTLLSSPPNSVEQVITSPPIVVAQQYVEHISHIDRKPPVSTITISTTTNTTSCTKKSRSRRRHFPKKNTNHHPHRTPSNTKYPPPSSTTTPTMLTPSTAIDDKPSTTHPISTIQRYVNHPITNTPSNDFHSTVNPPVLEPITDGTTPTLKKSTSDNNIDLPGIESHLITFLRKIGWTNHDILFLKKLHITTLPNITSIPLTTINYWLTIFHTPVAYLFLDLHVLNLMMTIQQHQFPIYYLPWILDNEWINAYELYCYCDK